MPTGVPMEEEQMEDSPPPRLLPSPNGITLVKKEERRLSSCSPVTLSPRGERTTPTLLQPRQPVLPIGVMGGAQVFMVGGQQEEVINSQVVNLMVESSVEELAGVSPQRSPYQMDSQEKCCSIEMVEEPEEKFRFRYKSEMQGTHGCIHGRTYSKKNKTFPTVQVHNVPADLTSVRLRIALYTNETNSVPQHHVHKMMWKQASDTEQDFIECNAERDQGFRHSWQGLGIIHTSRKNIDQTLTSRISKLFIEKKQESENAPRIRLTDAEELKLKAEAHKLGKQVTEKLNTVVLGVEAFRVDDHGIYRPLCPMVFSNPINNLKNPSTGELKICRISAFAGSVEGEEEVIILIERVKKGDIHVRFFELDQDEERVWEELAEFQEGDVHHQYAIVFKTPKYRDVDVTQDVGVYFELYRPSDGAVSDPKAFRYKPSGKTRLGKRARLEPLAIRSRPLPLAAEESELSSSDPGLNLNNIIDDLMRNPEYLESLNEPTPYDHIQNIPNLHCSSDIVPDLLQFPRSQGAIASDSVGPLDSVAVTSGQSKSQELDEKVMEGLISALLTLTTNDSPRARSEARELLLETIGCEGNNVLHTAIIKEASDSVKVILRLVEKSGEQEVLEETNKAGLNALLLAVHTGQPEVVSMLLECGANPDSRDKDGESAVHAAVREESPQMLQILLKAGADPNLPSHLGKFPLHLAVEQNLLPLVRLMVDQGVDVEAREQAAGRTALHLAVDRQLEEMVRYLVKEAMVDLGREDYSGLTALAFAESCRNQNILRLITRGVKKQNK